MVKRRIEYKSKVQSDIHQRMASTLNKRAMSNLSEKIDKQVWKSVTSHPESAYIDIPFFDLKDKECFI
jgi:hypothetical protein